MGKTHVKGLPLGAIIFVLILIGGVFPSMAQAVNLTINFVGSGTGRVDGSDVPGTGPFFIFTSQTIPYDLVQPPALSPLRQLRLGLGHHSQPLLVGRVVLPHQELSAPW